MEKYLSIRVQTALYISIFFISLHHVFVYLTNSSIFRYNFNLKISEVIFIYGISATFGISTYLILLKFGIKDNIKNNIYKAIILAFISLVLMYYFALNQNLQLFILSFFIHQLLTPYIMFNLDSLFEAYTNLQERGRARGIYLTAWNIPFVLVPLIMSTLSVENIYITYFISSTILLPFFYMIFYHIKNPDYTEYIQKTHINLREKLKSFFKDNLNKKAFIIQSSLHLYYGTLVISLPIYLYSVFNFDWDKIGLIIATMTSSFALIQIPFGNMEDKKHNEKALLNIGLFMTIFFTTLLFFIRPTMDSNISFILFALFLFLGHCGCSLIEISTEGMFYKHVTYKNNTALLLFRMGRILPYSLGILAIFFII